MSAEPSHSPLISNVGLEIQIPDVDVSTTEDPGRETAPPGRTLPHRSVAHAWTSRQLHRCVSSLPHFKSRASRGAVGGVEGGGGWGVVLNCTKCANF